MTLVSTKGRLDRRLRTSRSFSDNELCCAKKELAVETSEDDLSSANRLQICHYFLAIRPLCPVFQQNTTQRGTLHLQYVISYLQHTFSMLRSSAIRLGHTVSWLSKHRKMIYPLRNVSQLVIVPCNTSLVRCLCPVMSLSCRFTSLKFHKHVPEVVRFMSLYVAKMLQTRP